MDDIRKRHPDRPVVLTKENGKLQNGVRHIFAQIAGSLGEPGDLRDDGPPRQVGTVVQNQHEVTPRRHRVGRHGEVLHGCDEKSPGPSRRREAHLEDLWGHFENRVEERLGVGPKREPDVSIPEHVICARGWGHVVRGRRVPLRLHI